MARFLTAVFLGSALCAVGAIGAGASCKANGSSTFGNGHGADGTGASGTGGGFNTGGWNFGTGGGAGHTGQGGGCAGSSIQAQKIPLDMYVMLDQSGSMDSTVSGGGTAWAAVTGALGAFVQQPEAIGMGVGLQYFPLSTGGSCPAFCTADPDCGPCGPCFFGICLGAGSNDSCNAADYATPEVPIQTLPGPNDSVVSAILGSLQQHAPTTNTPTSAALEGAIDYAQAWGQQHADHVTIVVLATDGDPTECDTDLAHINAIAAAGAAGTPKILTFVIGVGTSLTALNGIAAAGGTGAAFLVDTGQNVNQQFLDALNVIQGQALGCNYTIPQPQQGELDYGKVNVRYTPDPLNAPGVFEDFLKVNGAAECPPSGGAWYYDDNQNPQQIILCAATCAMVAPNANGKIDIVLGCESIIQ
ncbi:MAG: VWA domain-containing protein [Polyangiaceae bacterium]|nr:VWA domain-containing protein [Polyangiaceae bacterium]